MWHVFCAPPRRGAATLIARVRCVPWLQQRNAQKPATAPTKKREVDHKTLMDAAFLRKYAPALGPTHVASRTETPGPTPWQPAPWGRGWGGHVATSCVACDAPWTGAGGGGP